MRKFLAVFLVLFSAIVLIGCTEKGLYVEGEHTHAIDKTSVVLIVDKNGFITSVNIDVKYGETTRKALDYDYRMLAELLEQTVVDNQGIFGIKEYDNLDGVIGPVNTYYEVLTEVLKKALK